MQESSLLFFFLRFPRTYFLLTDFLWKYLSLNTISWVLMSLGDNKIKYVHPSVHSYEANYSLSTHYRPLTVFTGLCLLFSGAIYIGWFTRDSLVWREPMVAIEMEGKETPTLTAAQSVSHENEVHRKCVPHKSCGPSTFGSISCANMNGAQANLRHAGTRMEIRGMGSLCLFSLL